MLECINNDNLSTYNYVYNKLLTNANTILQCLLPTMCLYQVSHIYTQICQLLFYCKGPCNHVVSMIWDISEPVPTHRMSAFDEC